MHPGLQHRIAFRRRTEHAHRAERDESVGNLQHDEHGEHESRGSHEDRRFTSVASLKRLFFASNPPFVFLRDVFGPAEA